MRLIRSWAQALLPFFLLSPAFAADPAARFRMPGPQSVIDKTAASAALDEAGVSGTDGLTDARRIIEWMRTGFRSAAAGGKLVGKSTAAGLLRSRSLSGCHDYALLLSALLRSAGYPAAMVDAAGVDWARDAVSGRKGETFSGHVFVQLRVDGRWVLLDSTSPRYLEGYDPEDPVILMPVGDQNAYYAMARGRDPADYGIRSIQRLNALMLDSAAAAAAARLGTARVLDLPGAETGSSLPDDRALEGPCALDPRRRGVVLQFPGAKVDAHIERAEGRYQLTTYPYGHVFQEPIRKEAFVSRRGVQARLAELSGGR